MLALKCIVGLIAGCILYLAYATAKEALKKSNVERTAKLMLSIAQFIVGLVLAFVAFTTEAKAQNVVKNGTTFEQVSTKQKSAEPTKTKYTYQTTDGKKYPIYVSAKGKHFIYRVSESGKIYKQYLPEVTKQLSQNDKNNSKDKP